MSVDELLAFYRRNGPGMFQRSRFLERLNSLYRGGALQQQLQEAFGATTTLGSADLKTLLLVVTRNVTTDSPWPISSNPAARYNDPCLADCNLGIPLWQLVRASTAAPIYFPPEVIQLAKDDPAKAFVFVDGGVTPYNNPAFLLFRFATQPAYRLSWPTGERNMLLVSVGTGAAATAGATADDPESNMVSTGLTVPTALLYGSLIDQDINCRTIGRCTFGEVIDSEMLDLIPREGPDDGEVAERMAQPRVPLSRDLGRAFLYARYNVDLSPAALARLGFPNVDAAAVANEGDEGEEHAAEGHREPRLDVVRREDRACRPRAAATIAAAGAAARDGATAEPANASRIVSTVEEPEREQRRAVGLVPVLVRAPEVPAPVRALPDDLVRLVPSRSR